MKKTRRNKKPKKIFNKVTTSSETYPESDLREIENNVAFEKLSDKRCARIQENSRKKS